MKRVDLGCSRQKKPRFRGTKRCWSCREGWSDAEGCRIWDRENVAQNQWSIRKWGWQVIKKKNDRFERYGSDGSEKVKNQRSKSLFFSWIWNIERSWKIRDPNKIWTCAMETGLERELPGSQCRRIACCYFTSIDFHSGFEKPPIFLNGPTICASQLFCGELSRTQLTASSCFLWGRRPRNFGWIPSYSVAYRHARFLMASKIVFYWLSIYIYVCM